MRTSSQLAEETLNAHAIGAWIDRDAVKQVMIYLSKRTIKDVLDQILDNNEIKSCRSVGRCNVDALWCDYHAGYNAAIQDLYSSIKEIKDREAGSLGKRTSLQNSSS